MFIIFGNKSLDKCLKCYIQKSVLILFEVVIQINVRILKMCINYYLLKKIKLTEKVKRNINENDIVLLLY